MLFLKERNWKQMLGLNLSKDVKCKYGEEFIEVEKGKLR